MRSWVHFAMLSSSPRFISFDAAQTLIRVNWDPARVAIQAVSACGIDCDSQVAGEVYLRLLQSGWGDYKQRNLSRDFAQVEAWWRELTERWAERMGWGADSVTGIVAAATEILYGPASDVFTLYDDTLPCLLALREAGIPCGILSNWVMSLHRVARTLGLTELVQFILCSDEEGVQKPDPDFFSLVVGRAGVPAGDILHVGDNPLDDVGGAHTAGMQALLIDRAGSAGPGQIRSLLELDPLLRP